MTNVGFHDRIGNGINDFTRLDSGAVDSVNAFGNVFGSIVVSDSRAVGCANRGFVISQGDAEGRDDRVDSGAALGIANDIVVSFRGLRDGIILDRLRQHL